MGKLEKSIYLVIILVLVTAIISGSIYLVMRDKDNTNTENNEVNDKNKESTDNKDNEKEEITLSEEELRKYLGYVPYVHDKDTNKNVYFYRSKNIDEINRKIIYGMVLDALCRKNDNCNQINNLFYNNADGEEIVYNFVIDEDDFFTLLKEMYNLSDITLTKPSQGYAALGYMCYYYDSNSSKFYGVSNCGGTSYMSFSKIVDYKVSNEELIIYEIYGYYDLMVLKNVITNQEYEVDTSLSGKYEELNKYFLDNIDKFPKYKHTFRKNETGYYWYQTEVVKD